MLVRIWLGDDARMVDLAPGGELLIRGGGATEEGWHYWEEVYRFDGETPTCQRSSSALDCDGRLDTYDDTAWNPTTESWERVSSSQRDHEAEKAGY